MLTRLGSGLEFCICGKRLGSLQEYAKDMAAIENMNTVDWAVVNPRRQEYIDRFNREVKA